MTPTPLLIARGFAAIIRDSGTSDDECLTVVEMDGAVTCLIELPYGESPSSTNDLTQTAWDQT